MQGRAGAGTLATGLNRLSMLSLLLYVRVEGRKGSFTVNLEAGAA